MFRRGPLSDVTQGLDAALTPTYVGTREMHVGPRAKRADTVVTQRGVGAISGQNEVGGPRRHLEQGLGDPGLSRGELTTASAGRQHQERVIDGAVLVDHLPVDAFDPGIYQLRGVEASYGVLDHRISPARRCRSCSVTDEQLRLLGHGEKADRHREHVDAGRVVGHDV
jgi:hypothetical protein